ncbi:zinc finger and BTB domain-containing protein 44-like [Hippopotamus amphibius kiboko]|uniref:zinc finger and BTB domain-containing protein 44-like n=1 Tax=Hippopotamus amphibius kiboko TaxID=575201 RepID=UPI0025944AC1|nr:zinc finger and BTB domain-containing protein 44-like [Hippopotamus amphibius kiboko]
MGVKTFTHSSSSHSQEMLGKLNMLRNGGHLCDITIRVQDRIFRAHKVVLAACSDFFRTKLVGQAEGENKTVLDLHYVTVTGFIPLLEYAYTATLSINTENVIDVLAAASYMQMFSVASACSEFMKSSVLWNTPNSQPEKGLDAGQENNSNCNFMSQGGSISQVSSACSVVERTFPVCRESRRKRKSYVVTAPESPVKRSTQTSSPQVLNSSASYSENRNQPVDSSLGFSWTFPFGIHRRIQPDKVKQAENTRTLESPGPSETGRRMADYVTCESTKTTLPLGTKEDVRVKVERLSDEEVHEEVSQPVSASQSAMSDQQTVPGSEQVQEDLLMSLQSSTIGAVDEGVTEGLPTLQSTSSASAHADDDDRLENVQYPCQLYIAPSTSSTERPSPDGADRPFQCPTCGVRFTRIQNLKQHMLIHSGIKPFQCDCCGKKFTRAYSLKMHRLKHEVIS